MSLTVNYSGSDNEQALSTTRLTDFLSMTPKEVDGYIDAHVFDLASAKEVLRELGMLLNIVSKEVKKLGVL